MKSHIVTYAYVEKYIYIYIYIYPSLNVCVCVCVMLCSVCISTYWIFEPLTYFFLKRHFFLEYSTTSVSDNDEWKNEEWMVTILIHTNLCEYTENEVHWSIMHIRWCIWSTTTWITDGSHWLQKCVTFINCLNPKTIVLSHGC